MVLLEHKILQSKKLEEKNETFMVKSQIILIREWRELY